MLRSTQGHRRADSCVYAERGCLRARAPPARSSSHSTAPSPGDLTRIPGILVPKKVWTGKDGAQSCSRFQSLQASESSAGHFSVYLGTQCGGTGLQPRRHSPGWGPRWLWRGPGLRAAACDAQAVSSGSPTTLRTVTGSDLFVSCDHVGWQSALEVKKIACVS